MPLAQLAGPPEKGHYLKSTLAFLVTATFVSPILAAVLPYLPGEGFISPSGSSSQGSSQFLLAFRFCGLQKPSSIQLHGGSVFS
jgi:hypothetical protein